MANLFGLLEESNNVGTSTLTSELDRKLVGETRHALQGPTKQGHQRELGGNHVALVADHVDRTHAQHAIGVAAGDAVHENRNWQHRGAGRLRNWVVPVGTEQGAILACLLDFE